MEWFQKLENDCKGLVEGCRKKCNDFYLYTPDGVANYDGLWIRDFAYMVEYAGNLLDIENDIKCIEYTLSLKRDDGWIPDRVYPDNLAVYAAGATGHPIGEANLDTVQFLIYAIYHVLRRLPKDRATVLFNKWKCNLDKALEIMPISGNGLVFNDQDKPHSPYGFTDTVRKTGELLMESVLHWRALKMMQELSGYYCSSLDDSYAKRIDDIERNIGIFHEGGVWYAATGDCRQIDIWAMAYMVYIGFPLKNEEKTEISEYLAKNADGLTYLGQIRHLPKNEYWERLLIEIEPETYQNGAYWETATGWYVYAVSLSDRKTAAKILADALAFSRKEGYFECVNEGYRKLPQMVVSGTNLYGAVTRFMEDGDTAFLADTENMLMENERT